jgi:hypothetical protein
VENLVIILKEILFGQVFIMTKKNWAEPYWHVEDPYTFPELSFFTEIVNPETNETYPRGAVFVFVGTTKMHVAALPLTWCLYSNKEIVQNLWPEIISQAKINGALDKK